MASIKTRRDFNAVHMFGRKYDYCNSDEQVLVLKEMREALDSPVLLKDEVLCERNSQGAWVCSAIIGGVRLHRTYMFYTERQAVKDFRTNPPGIN